MKFSSKFVKLDYVDYVIMITVNWDCVLRY